MQGAIYGTQVKKLNIEKAYRKKRRVNTSIFKDKNFQEISHCAQSYCLAIQVAAYLTQNGKYRYLVFSIHNTVRCCVLSSTCRMARSLQYLKIVNAVRK